MNLRRAVFDKTEQTRRIVRSLRRRSAGLLRRSAGFLEASVVANVPTDLALDVSSAQTSIEFPTAIARPLPDGWSEEEVRDVMSTFRIDGSAEGELQPYVDDALWRFLHTWGMVKDESGRLLELGANPYFITWLLREFTDLDLVFANYFGGPSGLCKQLLELRSRGETQSIPLDYHSFNLEEEAFPFETSSFEVVVFCEIIEHLLMNPLHCLREIHRILVPGGLLVLSTPNVSRLGNVLSMVEGVNIYDPYSGHGPYGRHNREFNRHELHRLLEFAGFDIPNSFTADAHPSHDRGRASYPGVAPLVVGRSNDLGQYVFVSARATGTPRTGLPTMLYRSWPADEMVSFE
jgi:SAM-dependent methyltransferase